MGRRVGSAVGFLLVAGLLAFGQACPTVAVFIPEVVLIGRVQRPIPDPAAETAIIEHFLSYGFNVVDLVHIKLLRTTPGGLARTQDLARRALAGDQVAIRELAARDGAAADVLVVGEAVSTVNVAGIEIFGFRFGASPQDIARAAAREIASQVGGQCRGR